MQPRTLPRHLDQPQRILIFQADELMPAVILFTIGIAMGHLGKFMLLGAASIWLMRRFRHTKPDGFVIHALYWYGLPVPFRTTLNPFLRRVLPA